MSATTTDKPDTLKNGASSQDGTAAEWVAVDTLRAWSKNPRKNDGEPVRKVAESIKRFGFGAPIIARRENGEIIAGHTRWKAAKKLGMATVPVRFLDLDEGSAHLLAIADNRVGEEAEWDGPMLAAALADMNATAEMVEATGFEVPELNELFGTATAVSEGDAFGALPIGDRKPFMLMVFTLHDEQAAVVKEAVSRMVELSREGKTEDTSLNLNRNGNALAAICTKYLRDVG